MNPAHWLGIRTPIMHAEEQVLFIRRNRIGSNTFNGTYRRLSREKDRHRRHPGSLSNYYSYHILNSLQANTRKVYDRRLHRICAAFKLYISSVCLPVFRPSKCVLCLN